MPVRRFLNLALCGWLLSCGLAVAATAPAAKVLRVTFQGSESGFDPAQISDVVSAAIVGSLFDSLLTYDYLARPVRLKPNTAVALPELRRTVAGMYVP